MMVKCEREGERCDNVEVRKKLRSVSLFGVTLLLFNIPSISRSFTTNTIIITCTYGRAVKIAASSLSPS